MTSVLEHRRHPRVPCRLEAIIREVDSSRTASTVEELKRQNQTVVINNVSLGGVCLESEANVTAGKIIRLEFSLPEHNHIAAFVEICWAGGRRLGLRFLALSDKGLNDLRQFILRHQAANHNHDHSHPQSNGGV
jgi:hypothetical protein